MMFERLTGVIARLAGRSDESEPLKVQIPSTVAIGTVDGIPVYNESSSPLGVTLSTSYLGQDACQPVTSTEFTPTVPVKSMPVPP
jgi:hypothetical protein